MRNRILLVANISNSVKMFRQFLQSTVDKMLVICTSYQHDNAYLLLYCCL